MSVIISITPRLQFIKEFVSAHNPIICNGLKILTLMFLSIGVMVNFVSNALILFKVIIHKDDNGIDPLMQWLKF